MFKWRTFDREKIPFQFFHWIISFIKLQVGRMRIVIWLDHINIVHMWSWPYAFGPYTHMVWNVYIVSVLYMLFKGAEYSFLYSDKSSVCGQKQWQQLLKLENRWLLPRCTAPSEQITWKWRLVTPDSWEETNYDITTFKYVHTTRLYCIIIEIIGVQQIFSKNGWISLLLPIKYNFFHSQNPRNINYRVTQQPIYL